MKRVKCLVTHVRPHLDEIAAIWLLRKFGKKKYPGVEDAEIVFWTLGGETPDGRSAQDWENDGCLLIGTGRGRFDEHPGFNGQGESCDRGECAATLVAKDLGVDKLPALKQILKYVKDSDLNGQVRSFDMAVTIQDLNRHFSDAPEKVIDWAISALEAKYGLQREFHETAKHEFENKAEIHDVKFGGQIHKVVFIESDNESFSRYARSNYGCQASVVVQKNSRGNVQIHTNQRKNLTITDIVQMLRLEEQKIKGKMLMTDWNELARGGKVEGAEEWYFSVNAGMLLNGALSAPDVPPTNIPFQRIKEIVLMGINPEDFPEFCITSPRCFGPRCRLYQSGLHRCRKKRWKAKEASRAQ
ncbi:hypothetical protein KJ969_05170 [Patescibacteria group bacterium]|nr:hypothetical protein [Patescibacteria group bacterium]MBU1921613.1 hypothetical protein [Patescibacteria group bacterium]